MFIHAFLMQLDFSNIGEKISAFIQKAIQWLTDKTGSLINGKLINNGGNFLNNLGISNSFVNTPLFWIIAIIAFIIIMRIFWRITGKGMRYLLFMILGAVITFAVMNYI